MTTDGLIAKKSFLVEKGSQSPTINFIELGHLERLKKASSFQKLVKTEMRSANKI